MSPPPGRRLLLATTNPGKLRELGTLLAPLDLELVTAAEVDPGFDVAETGATFEENAALKARAWAERAGMPALADDSGIEVDALSGRPGVTSARWVEGTDQDRMHALLDRLSHIADPRARTARYRAVAALAVPGADEVLIAAGILEGRIAHRPRGQGGFGYDPIFIVVEGEHAGDRTVAELSPAEKNAISHRARAVIALLPALRERFGIEPERSSVAGY